MEQTLDGVRFCLRTPCDLRFLSRYGRAFCVFDRNDSGNLSFGLEQDGVRTFVKLAGLPTCNASSEPQTAVENLRRAAQVYADVRHPNLIRLREHYAFGPLYVAAFDWADGECLCDHWNFDRYAADPTLSPPRERFRALPPEERLDAYDALLAVVQTMSARGYFAMDLYDGSLLYDFARRKMTVCDIDLAVRMPYVNRMGRLWGSSRFQSPEEYALGATVDGVTNVFTLGALAFFFFGDDRNKCAESWNVSPALYAVAVRAIRPARDERYPSVDAFADAWRRTRANA
mgnify:FL=1